MKKKLTCLLLGVLAVLLTGCSSVGLSVEKLMHPPKAVGDKAEIQSLIDLTAGEGYTLKYPQSGSFRSAITMKDIDSDGLEEAIAFYQPVGDIATVHILVMDNVSGEWQTVGDFKSQSTSVESLNFCDLDGNGVMEIVPSWKTYNANINQLSLYIYEDNKLREISCENTCSSLVSGDFTEQSGEELILLSLFSDEKDASAVLLDINENKSELISLGKAPLDPDVVSYAQLLVGNVFENQAGVAVDGCTISGEYNTQLLYFNNYFNSLERISFTENVAFNQALRSYPVMCGDVNGDSVIEVPAAFKLNIEKDRTDKVAAAEIYWCQQTQSGTVLLMKQQAASFAYGFTFEIPEDWKGNYTVLTDYETGEVTFYQWAKDKTADTLLTIKVMEKESDVHSSQLKNEKVLAETDSRVYTFEIPEGDNPLIISSDEVKARFDLM